MGEGLGEQKRPTPPALASCSTPWSHLGFDDGAFALLHHFRAEGREEGITRASSYCLRTGSFRTDGENERLQRRLALVLDAYRGGGFQTGRPEVFAALAEAAWLEIPPNS